MFDDFGLATPAVPGFWPEGDAVWQSFHDELVSQGVSEQTIKTVWEQTNKGTTQITDQDLMSILAANQSSQDSLTTDDFSLDRMTGQGNANMLFGDPQTQGGNALSFDDSGSAPFASFDASLPQSPIDFRTLMPGDTQKGSESLPVLQEFWQQYGDLSFPFELPSDEERAALVQGESQLVQLEAIYASIPEHVAGIPLAELRLAVGGYVDLYRSAVLALREWFDWLDVLVNFIKEYGPLFAVIAAGATTLAMLRDHPVFAAVQRALENVRLEVSGNVPAAQRNAAARAATGLNNSALPKDYSILYSWIGDYNDWRKKQGLPEFPAEEGWQGHHRIPQYIKDHPTRYPGWEDFDFGDPATNLRPINGTPIPGDINDHQKVTNEWKDWYAEVPNATPEEVEAFAKWIDQQYADLFGDQDEWDNRNPDSTDDSDNNDGGGFEA